MPTDSATAYEIHAQVFMQARDVSTIGADAVMDWCRDLPRNAKVLELACGAGYPVTRVLTEAGLRVWAMDSSSTLLDEFARRFPLVPVQCAKAQDSDFFGLQFDAVIAVGLMFLLSECEQNDLIRRIGKVLMPGGRFLFSAPLQVASWADITTGVTSRSLGRAHYEACLRAVGLCLVNTFADEGGNYYYDAQRVV